MVLGARKVPSGALESFCDVALDTWKAPIRFSGALESFCDVALDTWKAPIRLVVHAVAAVVLQLL